MFQKYVIHRVIFHLKDHKAKVEEEVRALAKENKRLKERLEMLERGRAPGNIQCGFCHWGFSPDDLSICQDCVTTGESFSCASCQEVSPCEKCKTDMCEEHLNVSDGNLVCDSCFHN